MRLRVIALLLASVLLLGSLSACDNEKIVESGSETAGESASSAPDTSETEEKTDTEAVSEENTEAKTEVDTDEETDVESETEALTLALEGVENGDLIEYAHGISNTVNTYFTDPYRLGYAVENKNMSLKYDLATENGKYVSSLTNKKGSAYLENTFDVFVRMKNGEEYYASRSVVDADANDWRMGQYYYEVRIEGQNFINEMELLKEENINLKVSYAYDMKVHSQSNLIRGMISHWLDPRFSISGLDIDAESYTHIAITMKIDNGGSGAGLYIVAGDATDFTNNQYQGFNIIPDGEYHTYIIPLTTYNDYFGKLKKIRLDIDGLIGTEFEISEIKVMKYDTGSAPDGLSIARSFLTYADKLHHYVQFATTKQTDNIDAFGIKTVIPAEKVAKLVAKDDKGLHESIDEIDFASLKYIGFDIKGAGVFGYIMPCDGKSGKLTVTLEDGNYVLIQESSPTDGVLYPSAAKTRNANDFYMGQRLYTDTTHSFDRFIDEADKELSPLSAINFKVSENSTVSTDVVGYDALRGYYLFNIGGPGGFDPPYYQYPNRHFNVEFDVRGDNADRTVYIMAHTTSGSIECSVLMDENHMLLPVSVESGKNFSEAHGERNLYNIDDAGYGEAIFPLVINTREKRSYVLATLYQNWGNYPLKQISWIQYYTPYYHLSTGVTETNCIAVDKNEGGYLPDFRGMSAPLWPTQPQHHRCAVHDFLHYTTADGSFSAIEGIKDTINSVGPTYADVTLDYITDDGKIKATYNHMEMPQTDENRTYYTITYEVLGDVEIKNFKNDFVLYSVRALGGGIYKQMGYLDENNNFATDNKISESKKRSYVLGDEYPYFTLFDFYKSGVSKEEGADGFANTAFLILDASFVIGGEKASPDFIVNVETGKANLSLNLEKVSLKAGDRIEINAILLPWGSHETVYSEEAPDINVRRVRENSLINKAKAEAVENCEVIETVYLPSVKSTNGKNATFKLSGGENNITVKVCGLGKMTAPKIYEKIDGEWQEYVVSSSKNPDKLGYHHYYDGYNVQYDGDGTFSYSFVVTMTEGKERTFKIEADADFEKWPAEETTSEKPLDVYLAGSELYLAAMSGEQIGRAELADDRSYVRIYGDGTSSESRVYLVSGGMKKTGNYIVIRYRIPKDQPEYGRLEFFTSTVNMHPTHGDGISAEIVRQTGEWAVLVLDASELSTFNANDSGEYVAKYLRFDAYNKITSTDAYIDVAYVGMSDDLKKICEINSDLEYLDFVSKVVNLKQINTKTGEIIEEEKDYLVHPDSEYKESELMYASWLDMINGMGLNGETALKGGIRNSFKGRVNPINYGGTTFDGGELVLSGWTVVEGGVDRYVFSVDGGKTWTDCGLYRRNAIDSAKDAHLNAVSVNSGIKYTFEDSEASKQNSVYQATVGSGVNCSGVMADLSGYAGETVDVIFAAVPTKDSTSLCPITVIAGVQVSVAE